MVKVTQRVYYQENLKREDALDKKMFDKLDKSEDGVLQREEIIAARRKEARWKKAGNIFLGVGGTIGAGIGLGVATVATGGVALAGAVIGLASFSGAGVAAIQGVYGSFQKELDTLEDIEQDNLPVQYDTGIDIEI